MRADLLTTREDLVAFRRTINSMRQQIEYDRDYHSKSELFHALDSYLNDVVEHLDEMDSKLKEHVYAYDVTVTVTKACICAFSRRVRCRASCDGLRCE